jgi:hypothetical protein
VNVEMMFLADETGLERDICSLFSVGPEVILSIRKPENDEKRTHRKV